MTTPTRDEIAMAVVRAIYGAEDRVKRGELVPPKDGADETRWTLFLGEIAADAILALLASKREAEPDVRTFGPIGPHPAPQTADGVPFWRVMPDPFIPHPQAAEPDAWMATTHDTPKEGDGNE